MYKRKESYGEHYNENLSFCLSVKFCFLACNNDNNNNNNNNNNNMV